MKLNKKTVNLLKLLEVNNNHNLKLFKANNNRQVNHKLHHQTQLLLNPKLFKKMLNREVNHKQHHQRPVLLNPKLLKKLLSSQAKTKLLKNHKLLQLKQSLNVKRNPIKNPAKNSDND